MADESAIKIFKMFFSSCLGGDLATIYRQSDIEDEDLTGYHAWIGLRIQDQRPWHWYWPNGQELHFWDLWDYKEQDCSEGCASIYHNSKK